MSFRSAYASFAPLLLVLVAGLAGSFPGATACPIGPQAILCRQDNTAVAEADLEDRLTSLPGAEVARITVVGPFTGAFRIRLAQPVDHTDPASKMFNQKVYLCHNGFDRPVLLDTDGYSAEGYAIKELTRILGANQILVEHRYFGDSRPDAGWEHLNVAAAADHHRIVTLFNALYLGPWISSGSSKGGQCALIHRSFYPDDVDATVAYVAPIILGTEDPRITEFLATAGDQECRDTIEDYQVRLLENRDAVLPLFKAYAREKGYEFSIGLDAAFESAVAEYSYSFWQYTPADAEDIPEEGAPLEELLDHLTETVSVYLYSDAGTAEFQPFFCQAYTEMGFYALPVAHIQDLLQATSRPSYSIFAPKDVPLDYSADLMRDILEWLEERGERIIYIYGERDPLFAVAVTPEEGVDALKVAKHGGSHLTRIKDLPEADQKRIIARLASWLGMDL